MIPKTRQIIVVCIGITALSVVAGWAFGAIATDEAQLIIMSIVTGFFTLLKGEQ